MATVLIVHFSQEDRSDRQALKPCSAVFIVIACCSQIEIAGAAPCRFWAKIRQPLCLAVFYRIMNGNEARLVVCTENLIRVDDVMESPKLAE
jgi:hypothetical protein